MNKYFKKFILFGDVDSHCLLCNETFQSLSQVEKHIRWENHCKSAKTQTYVNKFKQDYIYKLDKYYYCVICNFCMIDNKIITDHLNDETHKNNKRNPGQLNRHAIGHYDKGFVVMENSMKISNNQWNGIIENKCIICGIDRCDNITKHVKSQGHIINVIQTEIKSEKGAYYRKIYHNSFQCFTCMDIFPEDSFSEHFSNESHLEKMNTHSSKQSPTTNNNLSFNLDTLKDKELPKELQNILLKLNHDDPKLCGRIYNKCTHEDQDGMVLSIKKNDATLNVNKSEPIKGVELAQDNKTFKINVNHGKLRSELAIYGKKNFIKLSEGARKAYCNLCDVCISPNMKVCQSHVNGKYHVAHLRLQNTNVKTNENLNYNAVSYTNIIKNICYYKQSDAFVINNAFCITMLSLLFLKRINYNPQTVMVKCYACNIVFPPKDILNHCRTKQHSDYYISAEVLDIKHELIRKIQNNKYHCGLCNQILPSAEILEKHLISKNHNSNIIHSISPVIKLQKYFILQNRTPGTVPAVKASNSEAMYAQILKSLSDTFRDE